MKERGILCSAREVLALLSGTTQMRRVITPQPAFTPRQEDELVSAFKGATLSECVYQAWLDGWVDIPCPYGQPGDRLWVRETWRTAASRDDFSPARLPDTVIASKVPVPMEYMSDGRRVHWDSSWGDPGKTRASIHMPRWASRLTLDVTEVRVERLQAISEADAVAEGVSATVFENWTAYDPETEGYPSFTCEPSPDLIARRRLENVRHHGPKVLQTAVGTYRLLWDSINGAGSWASNPWVWAVAFKVLP